MTLVLPVATSFGSLAGLGVREESCDWLPAGTPCATASMGTQTSPFSGVSPGDAQSGGFKVPERCRVEAEPPRRSLTPTPAGAGSHKRKLPLDELTESRPRRISPFLNTPKQKRDEKRRVLRLSIQKLRQIDDPEVFLRRSVLINNTMKRMQKELREEKYASSYRSTADPPPRKRPCAPEPPAPSPSYMHLFDDPPNHFVNEMRITDDMSDTLVRTVMGLGDGPTPPSPVSSPSSLLTPSSSPSTDTQSAPCVTTDTQSAPCVTTDTQSAPCLSMDAHSAPCAKSKDCSMDTEESQSDSDCELNNNSRMCPNHNTSSEELTYPVKHSSVEFTDLTTYFPDDKFVNVTERDRQILGEMDAVFNNLISVLTES